MPTKIDWYNDEKTILYEQYIGNWTIVDANDGHKLAQDMLDTVEHKVLRLIDLTESNGMPNDLFSIWRLAKNRISKNQGTIILVKTNFLAEKLADLIRRMVPTAIGEIIFVETMDDALAELRKRGYDV